MPIFDPTLVQYFIQIPHIIFCCPLSAYDKWWFEQKKSPHFRERFLVLSYLKRTESLRPCAFFSMFLVTRPRSFWLKKKKKKKKKNGGSQNQSCWPSVSCARNTCTLHLQTRLSGCRNFFTVIARRKKNFLLLRSWMEVDYRVNVSNHYSKKHDAHHLCTFAKALKTPQRPLARIRPKQASYTV